MPREVVANWLVWQDLSLSG